MARVAGGTSTVAAAVAGALAVALGATGASPASRPPQVRYLFTDLGTLNGGWSTAFGLNNAGQVVGQSDQHAFLWTPSGTDGVASNPQMRDLGTLSGGQSFAFGINGTGEVVGESENRAFLWTRSGVDGPASNPQMRDLGTLGGDEAGAAAINDGGQVVGWADAATLDPSGYYYSHAFLWTPGGTDGVPSNPQMRDLSRVARSESEALAVNATGEIVGQVYTATVDSFAVRWDATTHALHRLDTEDLATAINSDGTIAGFGVAPPFGAARPAAHPFLWDPQPRDLGALGRLDAWATGLNTVGQVVGETSASPTAVGPHAFLWYQGRMIGLDRAVPAGSGWSLFRVTAINDCGQIAAQAWSSSSQHAILMSPFSICGKVTLNRRGLGGVRVTVGAETVFTGPDGAYVAPIPASGTYTVVPERRGYRFSPGSQSVTAEPCAGPIAFSAERAGPPGSW